MTGFIHYDYVDIFDSGLRSGDIALFFRIAIAGGSEKSCTVSVPKLAKWLNSSEQWVRGAVKRLEEAGFITVERTSGGSGRANTYHLVDRKGQKKKGIDKSQGKQTRDVKTPDEKTPDVKPCIKDVENPANMTSETLHARCPQKNNINNPSQRIKEKEYAGAEEVRINDYPVCENDLKPLFPQISVPKLRDYVFERMIDRWKRRDGSVITPEEIPCDLIEWLRSEENKSKLRAAEPAPPQYREYTIFDYCDERDEPTLSYCSS